MFCRKQVFRLVDHGKNMMVVFSTGDSLCTFSLSHDTNARTENNMKSIFFNIKIARIYCKDTKLLSKNKKRPLLMDVFRVSKFYLFPFARLCVTQSISQLLASVAPPLLHAVTWSASISESFHIRVLFELLPHAHKGQFE